MVSVRSAVVALVALTLPIPALAATFGPACWTMGNLETFRLFFAVDRHNPVAASVVGAAPQLWLLHNLTRIPGAA